jgi:cysteinyl-tRNA synthetase
MSKALLGESFDIHGGGNDLMFPHHENEIAQSCCAHPEGIRAVWMHNEMLQVEGKKMSKSLGQLLHRAGSAGAGRAGRGDPLRDSVDALSKPMDWTEKKRHDPRPPLLYDTTLRDGQQTQGVQFSTAEKPRIAEALDALGLDYIEGGWPGANPTDSAFFDAAPRDPRHHDRLRHDQARGPVGGE